MEFINSEKVLSKLIENLRVDLDKVDHDYLVSELYKHIEYTRRLSYYNAYQQGKFDTEMNRNHQSSFNLSHNTK